MHLPLYVQLVVMVETVLEDDRKAFADLFFKIMWFPHYKIVEIRYIFLVGLL